MKRAVCLNCIDGRVQIPVIEWIKQQYDADYVDMITEPGMDGLLSDPDYDARSIKEKVTISIEKNNASVLCVAGHYDCKGNPVSEPEHKKQVLLSVEYLKREFAGLEIAGVWINDTWAVERIV